MPAIALAAVFALLLLASFGGFSLVTYSLLPVRHRVAWAMVLGFIWSIVARTNHWCFSLLSGDGRSDAHRDAQGSHAFSAPAGANRAVKPKLTGAYAIASVGLVMGAKRAEGLFPGYGEACQCGGGVAGPDQRSLRCNNTMATVLSGLGRLPPPERQGIVTLFRPPLIACSASRRSFDPFGAVYTRLSRTTLRASNCSSVKSPSRRSFFKRSSSRTAV